MGVVASTYEPLEIKFNSFEAPAAGHYRLRFNALLGVGRAGQGRAMVDSRPGRRSPGRRSEPVTVYAETPPRLLRRLGSFDVAPEPAVKELDVWLLAGETIRPDAARLFRSRPPKLPEPARRDRTGAPAWRSAGWRSRDRSTTSGRRRDTACSSATCPLEVGGQRRGHGGGGGVRANPRQDAERLLRSFVRQAYRRPVAGERGGPLLAGHRRRA